MRENILTCRSRFWYSGPCLCRQRETSGPTFLSVWAELTLGAGPGFCIQVEIRTDISAPRLCCEHAVMTSVQMSSEHLWQWSQQLGARLAWPGTGPALGSCAVLGTRTFPPLRVCLTSSASISLALKPITKLNCSWLHPHFIIVPHWAPSYPWALGPIANHAGFSEELGFWSAVAR